MKTIYLFLAFWAACTYTQAQELDFPESIFNLNKDQVAVQGYDLVSYFTSEPTKGQKEINIAYKGVIYWFSSEENRDLFGKTPERFLPAYGGWCAYAMGLDGSKVKIDPETFKIIDGKLYLFYNAYFNNTLIDWNKNEIELKKKADRYWAELITEREKK